MAGTRKTPSKASTSLSIVHPSTAQEMAEGIAASDGVALTMPAPAPAPRRASQMRLQYVVCPLKEYEHIGVLYRTNNKKWVREQLLQVAEQTDEQFNELVSQFVLRVDGWNFLDDDDQPVPPPDKDHMESFVFLFQQLDDLGSWMIKDGYIAAKEQASKN